MDRVRQRADGEKRRHDPGLAITDTHQPSPRVRREITLQSGVNDRTFAEMQARYIVGEYMQSQPGPNSSGVQDPAPHMQLPCAPVPPTAPPNASAPHIAGQAQATAAAPQVPTPAAGPVQPGQGTAVAGAPSTATPPPASAGQVPACPTPAGQPSQPTAPAPARPAQQSTLPASTSLVQGQAGLLAAALAVDNSHKVAVAIKTTGPEPWKDKTRLLSLVTETIDGGTYCYLVDCTAVDPTPLWQVLAGRTLLMHDAGRQLAFLGRLGFTPAGAVHDNMLHAQLLTAGYDARCTLPACCKRWLRRDLDTKEYDWSRPLGTLELAQAAEEVGALFPLFERLQQQLEAANLTRVYSIEQRALPAITWMSMHGVPVDRQALEQAQRQGKTGSVDWLKHVQADGRIYPHWRQIGTATGRMSCSSPNVQSFPREHRRCIAAPPGRVLVRADYSQIELRVAASVSRDKALLDAFRSGADPYKEFARQVLGNDQGTAEQRGLGKRMALRLLYGMGIKTLAAKANISPEQAADYRRRFFAAYPGLDAWCRSCEKSGREYTRTRTGRVRWGVKKSRARLNSPIQGLAADGFKTALALMWERRDEVPRAFPVLAVHDEIVVECDATQADAVATWLETCMVDGMAPLIDPVPVKVEVRAGRTWAGG